MQKNKFFKNLIKFFALLSSISGVISLFFFDYSNKFGWLVENINYVTPILLILSSVVIFFLIIKNNRLRDSNILPPDDPEIRLNWIIEIEKNSKIVCIVSQDLKKDFENLRIRALVKTNLSNDVIYRILLPDNKISRKSVADFANILKLPENYSNPTILFYKANEVSSLVSSFIIFNPESQPKGLLFIGLPFRFIKLSEPQTMDYIRKFNEVWDKCYLKSQK